MQLKWKFFLFDHTTGNNYIRPVMLALQSMLSRLHKLQTWNGRQTRACARFINTRARNTHSFKLIAQMAHHRWPRHPDNQERSGNKKHTLVDKIWLSNMIMAHVHVSQRCHRSQRRYARMHARDWHRNEYVYVLNIYVCGVPVMTNTNYTYSIVIVVIRPLYQPYNSWYCDDLYVAIPLPNTRRFYVYARSCESCRAHNSLSYTTRCRHIATTPQRTAATRQRRQRRQPQRQRRRPNKTTRKWVYF